MRALAIALLLPGAALAQGVPSGQPVALWEVLFERVGDSSQMVMRFLAPGIGEAYDRAAAEGDLDWLCDAHGAAIAATPYARADSIVVTLMDRPVRRGSTDTEAVQFFGVYALDGATCVAEPF